MLLRSTMINTAGCLPSQNSWLRMDLVLSTTEIQCLVANGLNSKCPTHFKHETARLIYKILWSKTTWRYRTLLGETVKSSILEKRSCGSFVPTFQNSRFDLKMAWCTFCILDDTRKALHVIQRSHICPVTAFSQAPSSFLSQRCIEHLRLISLYSGSKTRKGLWLLDILFFKMDGIHPVIGKALIEETQLFRSAFEDSLSPNLFEGD